MIGIATGRQRYKELGGGWVVGDVPFFIYYIRCRPAAVAQLVQDRQKMVVWEGP